MGRHLIVRLSSFIGSIFILVTTTFFLLRLLPGGPFDSSENLSVEIITSLNQQYGLNKNIFYQYTHYLYRLLHFDFGLSSLFPGKSVYEVLKQILIPSLQLGGTAIFLSIFFGIFFGFIISYFRKIAFLKTLNLLFLSIPMIFLAPISIYIFSLKLQWLPLTASDSVSSYFFPALLLSIRQLFSIAKIYAHSLQETMTQDWVFTLRAYGASQKEILFRYCSKQALLPLLSYLAPTITTVLSGSVFLEILFNIQGIGTYFIDAITNRDYSLVMAIVLFYGSLLIRLNFIFDLATIFLDPRLKESTIDKT